MLHGIWVFEEMAEIAETSDCQIYLVAPFILLYLFLFLEYHLPSYTNVNFLFQNVLLKDLEILPF